MQTSAIPSEIATQAMVINRFGGTLQAWAFLVSHGVEEKDIFALLIAVEGPEYRSSKVAAAPTT